MDGAERLPGGDDAVRDVAPVDQPPLDLSEGPEPPRGGARRVRWRIVLSTVVVLVVATSSIGWGVGAFLGSRRIAGMIAGAEPAKRAIAEDHAGAHACHTPSFELGRYEVALLRAAPLPEGGWALHAVVHGGRLASGTGRFVNLAPIGPGAEPSQVPAQPGATWADAFVATPPQLGDRFDVSLVDLRSEVVGTFTVDVADLACDVS